MKYTKDEYKKLASKEEQNTYLIKYLQHLTDLSTREQQSKENYSLPAWPFFQADENGKQKIIRKILTLIS